MDLIENRLNEFYKYLSSQSEKMIGYPANQDYDYSKLYDFFKLSINNIGDPLSDGPYKVKAHEFEKEVIEFVVKLTGQKDQNFWGYVTNGGTEGNMYGLYVARELYPKGVVYYSQSAHYSIPKILKLLNMPSIAIRSDECGCMCLKDLKETLAIHRTKVPIILATLGTTMFGALDPLKEIQELIRSMAFPNHYIHVDAALSGFILPFIENAPRFGLDSGVHSFSISGHKMLGSPMPCGIVVARKDYVDRVGSSVEYIGALDTTLSGSRNGHSTLLLWYAIEKNKKIGFKNMIQRCLEVAEYTYSELSKRGLNPYLAKHSITVVFDRPSEKMINKWQLAYQGDKAHIITMPHVSKLLIDEFLKDLDKSMEKNSSKTPDTSGDYVNCAPSL